MRTLLRFFMAVSMATGLVATAGAVQTKVVLHDTYDNLAPGKLNSVSLSDEGELSLALEVEKIHRPDAELIWSIAVAADGRIFFGSGHEGKIFVSDNPGTGAVYLDMDAPEVTALCFHGGNLFAATAPDGKLWVCDQPDTATLVFDTEQDYIWDIAVDKGGNLILGTGPDGKVFRVDPIEKKGSLLFDAPDEHVLSLAFGPEGRLHASTSGKGRVYRWTADEATTPVVLLEEADNEIRKIVIDPAGNVFAALNSEALARRVVSPLAAALKKASEGEGSSSDSSTPQVRPSSPAGKSQIYLIDAEGFVRSLWTVSEAPVHDMAFDADTSDVLIAAGDKGKIFRLNERGRYWIVTSVEEEQVFAMEPAGDVFYLATVGPAMARRLGSGLADNGTYLSPAINAGASVRWGTIRREGSETDQIEIQTRSGNTAEPDDTWYGWKPVKWTAGPGNGTVQSEVARYLQWRATFTEGQAGNGQLLDLVEVFYVPANESPHISKIEVKKPSAKSGSSSSSKPSSGSNQNQQKKNGEQGEELGVDINSNPKRIEIAWQVEDPNDDKLEAALYFKGEDESTWKLIKDELEQPKYVFGTGTLPDSHYRIKVVVTDKPANYGPNARKDELISDRFVIDNGAPEIGVIKATRKKDNPGVWTIAVTVEDDTSLIADARYNINGQDLKPLVPIDGLFDQQTEDLEFVTDKLEGEEHVLGLVITDREGNSAVGRAILRP